MKAHSVSVGDLISVVVPVYNEQEVLGEFHARLSAVCESLNHSFEVVYVNDGSTDQSLAFLESLKQVDPRISLVNLSRNFGKEIAMSAGLDYACGMAVVIIDADLQDPPEVIPELVNRWRDGYDVVYAKRVERKGETYLKKATAHAFYRIIKRMSDVQLPEDTGDFRLLSRRAVDALKQFREQHRFMKGLFAWIGYSQIAVPYQRASRFSGQTKWSYWKLWNLAIEGITSFSISPLKIATYFGLIVAFFAFLLAVWIVIKTLLFGDAVRGYPTIMVTMLLLGGTQLVAIGILGEYLGRVFNETKRRPLYLVDHYFPADNLPKEISMAHDGEEA